MFLFCYFSDNKFFTETASYQRLKIRSADNQKYLCARTNGEIVFKVSPFILYKHSQPFISLSVSQSTTQMSQFHASIKTHKIN